MLTLPTTSRCPTKAHSGRRQCQTRPRTFCFHPHTGHRLDVPPTPACAPHSALARQYERPARVAHVPSTTRSARAPSSPLEGATAAGSTDCLCRDSGSWDSSCAVPARCPQRRERSPGRPGCAPQTDLWWPARRHPPLARCSVYLLFYSFKR
jgi:hypothetical protein